MDLDGMNQIMYQYGYVLVEKPFDYDNTQARYIMTGNGKTLTVYANWLDLQADYDLGLVLPGIEHGVTVTNPDDFLNGPGQNFDTVWDFQPLEGASLFPWAVLLKLMMCIVIGIIITVSLWQIENQLYPCEQKEYNIGQKKIIVNPNCSRWELDTATGKVTDLGGGVNDWIIWLVVGIIAIGGIYLISQSGILKGLGGSSSGGGGGGGSRSSSQDMTYSAQGSSWG